MEELTEKKIRETILPEIIPKLLEETKNGKIKWETTGSEKNPDACAEQGDLKITIEDSGYSICVESERHDFKVDLSVSLFAFGEKVKPLRELYSLLKKQRAEELQQKIQEETDDFEKLIAQADNENNNQSPKKKRSARRRNLSKKKKTPAPKKKHVSKEKQQTLKKEEPKIGRL